MSTSLDDIELGQIISFRSKAVSDNNFYYGKVIGFISSEVAVSYFDIYTYNSNVQTSDELVGEVETQDFILVRLIDKLTDSEKYVIAFSKDWIEESSLSIHNNKKIANINVYEVDSTNIQDVLDLLMANGFKVKTISLT